ncbi:Ldh family oxidoreductase [Halomarina pelagica]|uniref:Ldh family oxidoreductase n=1 Tax=Halomarina pelagica TaxID=2961599 RepID=UPI0020C3A849|nr:Ldh family oxidoreductase [Halomarina sp. BND7]
MRRIDAAELEAFVRAIVAGLGADEDVAAEVAASLVEADLAGHGSHGSIRMGTSYAEMIETGDIDPGATPDVARLSPTAARVDGNLQYGQVVGRRAVEVGVDLASGSGVAVVGVRDATHLGRVGEWAERAADAGFCFASFVNTGGGAPLVTPPGSADRLFATNPLAFGVPSFGALEHPVVLDIATSQVAHGKVTKRAVENRPIPDGWIIDAAGEAVTDPREYEDGRGVMLPLGGVLAGYKGFGLSMMVELFAGVVGDGRVSGQPTDRRVNNGAMFVFVDPDVYSSRAANRTRVEALDELLRSADYPDAVSMGPTAKGDRAMLPGEAEHATRLERLAEGIPFHRETLDLLADTAREAGAAAAVPDSFSP